MLRAVALGAGWRLLCAVAFLLVAFRRLDTEACVVPRRVVFPAAFSDVFFLVGAFETALEWP